MKSDAPHMLLYIEPTGPAAAKPNDDVLSVAVARALGDATPGFATRGHHHCICGERSTNVDYVLRNGWHTNSLAVHYMRYHRDEVPAEQIERIANHLVTFADRAAVESTPEEIDPATTAQPEPVGENPRVWETVPHDQNEALLRSEAARVRRAHDQARAAGRASPVEPRSAGALLCFAVDEIDRLREELARARGAYLTASGVPAHVRVSLGGYESAPDGRFIGVAPMNIAARSDAAPADAILEAAHAAAFGLIEQDPDNPSGWYSVSAYSDEGRITYTGVVDYRAGS